ncbi:hypothetical protein M3Y99_01332900 [Aphelenchoides fujianensis]|nr:hypothetical protein M3Y99_01332900 [Aphelenchoides fujianensis]
MPTSSPTVLLGALLFLLAVPLVCAARSPFTRHSILLGGDQPVVFKSADSKRFYDWDGGPTVATNLEKRFYSWEGDGAGSPQMSPKERQFLKQFIDRKGADWVANHRMFAQFKDSLLVRRR